MKTKFYIKLLLPLCAFAVLFRALEIIYAVEPSSGFYVNGSIIPVVFNIFIFLSVAFFISGIFITKTETKTLRRRLGSVNVVDRILCCLASVMMLAASLKSFLEAKDISFTVYDLKSALKDFSTYILIFAALSAVFFVFFSSSPKKYAEKPGIAVLAASVPLFYVLRLFRSFVDINNIISKAYGTYTILFLAAMVLSYLNLAKLIAGTPCKKQFTAYGLTAVFFAGVHIVELALSFVPGNPYNITVNILFFVADILCAAILLRFIILLNRKLKKNEPEDEQEPAIQPEPTVTADEKAE